MNQRKKILFCITKSVWGGAQVYVHDLAVYLPKPDFDVVVAAGGSGPLFNILQKNGIRTISIPYFERDIYPGQELRAFLSLVSIFIKEKPDIIHLNSSKAGSIGAVAAFITKCLTLNFKSCTVFTVHGWGFNEDRSTWQRIAIRTISRISSYFHNYVILINSADYRDALSFIPQKKCTLIPLGVGFNDILERHLARAFFSHICKTTITPSTFIIGVTAELTKNKGLSYLVDSLHHIITSLPQLDIHCVIMGEGKERESLQRHIDTNNLTNHITLAGFVANAQQYFSGCDMFVLPSVKEGLPYALMEAMAAGLAVIATRVGGVPDLIINKQNGFIVLPKNAADLAQCINTLLASASLRKYLGIHAKETIQRNYSLKNMIAATSHFYYELTKAH